MKKRMEAYLRVLCEEIGARPTGSEANRTAVEYVCEELKRSGLRISKQEFDCMDWSKEEGTLTVEKHKIPIAPAPYSLPCDLQGELICVHSLEELRTAPISGKIVVLCDALASEPLMPKSFIFWNPDEHKEIISLLENSGVKAVLTVSLSKECLLPVIEDGDFTVPCAMVLPEHVPLLCTGSLASLTLNTVRRPAKAANILAAYGSGKQKICLSAHIDTQPGTPGALDNASGVAVLLAVAAKLSGRELPCQIEFVLFNGEDYYSTPGEMLYLNTSLTHPDEYLCAFNIDGAGVKGKHTAYSFYECPQNLMESLTDLALKTGDFEQIEPWPQGDHTLFSFSGIPAIAITSEGIFELTDHVLHTESDTLEWIDREKLEVLVDFLLDAICKIA
ncbi:M28 family peptidase [Faecalicatena sp. AGMB00832]|uniref:M28 family peptidase n=1 Tax=Faecalicatena faecalis TaxID=2726362 RepID=A0ABS6D0Q3_9FIRM|nr:M28 family peptidase [Faecalicatena faecalis]MBU3874930.1 M28 family peptidase [Faecalicatena faecalis]